MRFAVVGDPVAHSKSPAMHAAAFRALGLAHTYEAVRATAAELPGVVQRLREGVFDGLNVTIPHKERVLALVDRVDDDAGRIGAANTLARVGGQVVAFNTDAPALAAELRVLAGDEERPGGGRALVLGNGGAARAARAALERHMQDLQNLPHLQNLRAAEIVVRARRPRGADEQPLAPSPSDESTTRFVVQATSAGMTGADPGADVAGAVAWNALPDDAVALDLVYAPPDTPFLRVARARGLRCANGLGMLVRQGALAFELWLGVPAPLEAMRAALQDLS